jgi:anaerobic selenocysteine-containing dehydrogenase
LAAGRFRTVISHGTWEMARHMVGRDFFGAYTVSELSGWTDYDLENAGRLAEPMYYDAATDKYLPIPWENALELVGATLRCHEASGRALTAAIGTGKGTVDLVDWEKADAIWLMGDNAATNAPRMLTWLAEADRRDAQLVHINPLIEAASRRTIVPHEFVDMGTFHSTKIGTMNVQVRIGGDMALLRGVAKAVFEAAEADPHVLDKGFLEAFTRGLEEYRARCAATPWDELVSGSGVDEAAIRRTSIRPASTASTS